VKPVDQTRFGYGEGNCLMAAVCSILEIPLEEPRGMFEAMREKDTRTEEQIEAGVDPRWWRALWQFCTERGWLCYYLSLPDNRPEEWAPKGWAVQCGTGPRGRLPDGRAGGHCVVALDGVIVHDPHPSRDGLLRVDGYIILVPCLALEIEPRTKGPEPRDDRPWDEEEAAA
jgi:hypothetical protein